jgi:hypothetical protein
LNNQNKTFIKEIKIFKFFNLSQKDSKNPANFKYYKIAANSIKAEDVGWNVTNPP